MSGLFTGIDIYHISHSITARRKDNILSAPIIHQSFFHLYSFLSIYVAGNSYSTGHFVLYISASREVLPSLLPGQAHLPVLQIPWPFSSDTTMIRASLTSLMPTAALCLVPSSLLTPMLSDNGR